MKTQISLKLKKFFLLFLIFPLLLAGCMPKQSDVDINYNNGLAYLEKHQYSSALQEFKTSINENPSNTDSYLKAAEILIKKKQYDEAITILLNGEKAVSEPDLIFQKLGEVNLAKRDYVQAETYFRQSIADDRSNWKSIEGMVVAFILQGKFEDATKMLDDSNVQDKVGNERLTYLKATLSADDYDQALEFANDLDQGETKYKALVEALNKAKETQDNKIEDLMNLAFVIINNEDNAFAIKVLEGVMKENEYYHGGQLYLGYVYLKLGEYEKSKGYLEMALELNSSDPTTLKLLAQAYGKTNQQKSALDTYATLVSLSPQDEEIRKDYIATLITFKDYQKAYEQAIAAISINPSIENRVNAMEVLVELQDYKGVSAQVDLAENSEEYINGNNEIKSKVLAYKGWALYKIGEKAEGKHSLEESLTISNLNAVAYLYLGIIDLEKEDYQNAKINLEKAVDLDLDGEVSYLANLELKKVK